MRFLHRTSPISLLIATLLCAGPAFAQPPSFDCGKAASSAEKLICADAELAALDRQLALRFAAAVTAADSLDAGRDSAKTEVRAFQRGWIKGRDDCWKTDNLRACVMQAYLTRDGELTAQWMLQEPTNIITYRCVPFGTEITAYFFDTPLPSVRLEFGDRVNIGTLMPAASGSKYALGSGTGATFWTHGDGAVIEVVGRGPLPCGQRNSCAGLWSYGPTSPIKNLHFQLQSCHIQGIE